MSATTSQAADLCTPWELGRPCLSCPTRVLQTPKEVWKQHKTLENSGVADGKMKAEGGEKGAETRLVSFSLRGHPPREEPGRASIWAEDWTFSVTGKLMPSLDSEGTSSNNSSIPINACETSAFQTPGSGRSLPLDSRSPPRAQGQPSAPVTSKRQPSYISKDSPPPRLLYFQDY